MIKSAIHLLLNCCGNLEWLQAVKVGLQTSPEAYFGLIMQHHSASGPRNIHRHGKVLHKHNNIYTHTYDYIVQQHDNYIRIHIYRHAKRPLIVISCLV